MIVQCAWCKKIMGEKEPLTDKSVTHTICKDCSIKFLGIDPKTKKETESMNNSKKKQNPPHTNISIEHGIHKGMVGWWIIIDKEKFGPMLSKAEAEKEAKSIRELIENPKKQAYDVWYQDKHTGKKTSKIVAATSKADAKVKFINIMESLRKGKSRPYPYTIIEVSKYIRKNPGAKWHEEQAVQAKMMQDTMKDDGDILKEQLYSGTRQAHQISAKESKKLGINPIATGSKPAGIFFSSHSEEERDKKVKQLEKTLKSSQFLRIYQSGKQPYIYTVSVWEKIYDNPRQSHYEDIEYTAVELHIQGHNENDIKILLKREFNIEDSMAKYYAKRAGQIVSGNIQYITPKIARLIQTIKDNPLTSKAKQFISDKIKILMKEGYKQKQAIAIAMSTARKFGYKVPRR